MTNQYRKDAVVVAKTKVSSHKSDFFRRNHSVAPVASKLVADRNRGYRRPGDGVDINNETIFDRLIGNRAQKNLDAETLMELQPDLKIIRQVITAAIISPIDIDSDQIIYRNRESDVPEAIFSALRKVIQDHMENYVKLNEELPDYINEAAFTCGSTALIVVPEAVIDDIINGRTVSTEAARMHFDQKAQTLKPIGILGPVTVDDRHNRRRVEKLGEFRVSVEDFFGVPQTPDMDPKINDMCSITDNMAMLRLPILKERIRQQTMREKINSQWRSNAQQGVSLESRVTRIRKDGENKADEYDIKRIQDSLYQGADNSRQRPGKLMRMPTAQEASRSSIGHPLIIKGYSDTLLPVFTPGDEKNHLGYIGVLDGTGQLINGTEELRSAINYSGAVGDNRKQMDMTSSLIQQTRVLSQGYTDRRDQQNTVERIALFTDIMEENLLSRLRNGLLGENVRLGRNENFYRVMLARNLANRFVNLIYIPADQVAYLAYEYDSNGMGVSLMDGIKEIATLRSMTTFSNFYSSVRNAVGRTKVTINIDPRSPDPEKDRDVLIDQWMRSQANFTPTDVSSSSDMFRVIRNMGVSFEIAGNDRIPNTTVNVEDYQSQRNMVDTAFTDELTKQVYMGLYVTPEMVDATQASDFAITRWTSNQLFSKRIRLLQKRTAYFLERFIKIYTVSDGDLTNQMQKVITDMIDKVPQQYKEGAENNGLMHGALIEEFLNTFFVELPTPNNAKRESQLEQLQKEINLIDAVLPAWISEEIIGSGLADANDKYVETVTAAVRSMLIRRFCADNNILPELEELTRKGSEDNPSLNVMSDFMVHITNLTNNIGDYMSAIKLRREKYMEQLGEQNEEYAGVISGDAGGMAAAGAEMTDAAGTDGGTGGAGGDEFDDLGGFDDLPADDDDPFADMGTDQEVPIGEEGAGGDQPPAQEPAAQPEAAPAEAPAPEAAPAAEPAQEPAQEPAPAAEPPAEPEGQPEKPDTDGSKPAAPAQPQ